MPEEAKQEAEEAEGTVQGAEQQKEQQQQEVPGARCEDDGELQEIREWKLAVEDEAAPALRLKNRKNVYMQMYQEAKRNAEDLREKALIAYLELLRVRDVYRIRDCEGNASDSEIDEIEFPL